MPLRMRSDEAAADPRAPHSGGPVRILIVDDSVVARSVLGRMVEASSRFTVAEAVSNVQGALAYLDSNSVDIVLLDIEMPGIDGLTALPDVLAAGKGAKVLIVSSSADAGGAATVQALALGAADTLVKPGAGSFGRSFAEVLHERLARLVDAPAEAGGFISVPAAKAPVIDEYDVVAIGASTGGIHAMSQLLREIPPAVRVPILITQHLPQSFMSYFATQLAVLASRPCEVATDRMPIRAGRIIVAPGDAHLRVVRTADGAAVRLSHDKAVTSCLPSVDPMFQSIAEVYGSRALGIVLSGMGRDGSDGARALVEAGASVVVQDRASSVVWGMPGAVASAGRAAAVMAPDQIGRLVASLRRPG